MKTSILCLLTLLALAFCSLARAVIVPVSSSSLVSISGHATVPVIYGGESESYATTRSAANFTSLTESLGGEAWAEITILPPFQLFLGTTLHVASRASQSATIDANGITLDSAVFAGSWPNSQVGRLGAQARALTEITFQVDRLSTFSLSGNGFHHQSDWPYVSSEYGAWLTAADGTSLFQTGGHWGHNFWFDLATPVTGTLAPGNYTLRASLNAIAVGDPIGESGSGNLSLSLRVSNIADFGSTAGALAFALLGLMLARRRLAAHPPAGA